MLSPFAAGAGRPVLLHVAHHKVGTVWFERILHAFADHYGLRFDQVGSAIPFQPGADIYEYFHARNFVRSRLDGRSFLGSHMVRDPRDVVVSAYHYHLWTEERWARTPMDKFGGLSYQEHLNSLDEREGLLVEMERTYLQTVADMGNWDYDQPEFLELRYEELVIDEHATFDRLFQHWQLDRRASALGHRIVDDMSFRNQAKRAVGEQGSGTHLRSGKPGEWRRSFGPEHVELFKELAGPVLIHLGYESDDDWSL